MQKHLKSRLSTAGATYVRFFYAWPFAVIYVWGLAEFGGFAVPGISAEFLIYCLLGGLSQIIFTFLLIWLFSFRNFAVGTTYSKTETAQVAILGLLILGDTLSAGAVIAIIVSLIGVMVDTELPLNRELIVSIENVINELEPAFIFVHYGEDTHQDHRVLNRATVTATRYTRNVLFYEPAPAARKRGSRQRRPVHRPAGNP